MNILDFLNKLKIADFWQIAISVVASVFVVYLIEWLKQPNAKIELISPLNHPDGRKFLKVKVKISKNNFLKKIFPWQNPATLARLKAYSIECICEKEVVVSEYTVKWDTRPEPWDYTINKPKLEFLPFASEPENLLAGDEVSASIAVKHPNERWFYIYDGNYYVNQTNNIVDKNTVKFRLVFSSSSVSAQKDFVIINEGKSNDKFELKVI